MSMRDPYAMPEEEQEWEKSAAALEKEERAREAAERQDVRDLEDRCRAVLATEEGRNWVWDLLCTCGVYRVSHTVGDPSQTAFNEGGRNVGLGILSELKEHAPDLCRAMEDQQRTR